MQQLNLLTRTHSIPEPADRIQAELGFQNLLERTASSGDDAKVFMQTIMEDKTVHALLAAIFGNSPFLSQCLLRDLPFTRKILEMGPESTLDGVFRDLELLDKPSVEEETLMKTLRTARGRCALLTAFADITGVWELDEVTASLSTFAEISLALTVNFLLRSAATAGQLELVDDSNPSLESGFVIIAMGKLGARELNFSSDIDFIAVFDQDIVNCTGKTPPQDLFVRLTQNLVRILQDRTSEGYVFRTDLRLRPDSISSPVALSMAAAENYYESVGQNWERAALIKARPVAGDRAAGTRYLSRIIPFVWRKNLDFAAIADIHSIKRQINIHKGHAKIAVAGHDVKLGRGGIREIEFFAQTQQLIAGGRDPRLRISPTRQAIRALVATDRLKKSVADELVNAYEFLRQIEHRLQMINDEQTHSLPKNMDGLQRLSIFMKYESVDAFSKSLLSHLEKVVSHYSALFEHAPPLGPAGNLVFTGIEDDPQTVETLRRHGFREPEIVTSRIRSWQHGRYRATRSVRARELLTALVPRLLDAFANTTDPDTAMVKFDEFLRRLPSSVQLFSLFYENPKLVDLVAEIMGSAPRLAGILSGNTSLFDAVLGKDFLVKLPSKEELFACLNQAVTDAADFQDALDYTRHLANEYKFQAGVQVLRNSRSAHEVAPMLSDLAEGLICTLLPIVQREFTEVHGRIHNAEFAVIGLGKLGARELNSTSDLDLIFLYDNPDNLEFSDGAKPLATSHYFARLSQRLINALSAMTGEGQLYEVDMRLRPAGEAGPIASHISAFNQYQRESAWTWEHMALTRANVISASASFKPRISNIIREVLTLPRDSNKMRMDISTMRDRIYREHNTSDYWEVKHVRGGLIDLQFLCQYLQLRFAYDHPEILHPSTQEAFHRLGSAGILHAELVNNLVSATLIMHNVQGLLRLTMTGPFSEASAPDGLQRSLAMVGESENLTALRDKLCDHQQMVLHHFRQFMETPIRGKVSRRPKARV